MYGILCASKRFGRHSWSLHTCASGLSRVVKLLANACGLCAFHFHVIASPALRWHPPTSREYNEVNLGVRVEGEIDPSYRIGSLISHSTCWASLESSAIFHYWINQAVTSHQHLWFSFYKVEENIARESRDVPSTIPTLWSNWYIWVSWPLRTAWEENWWT
jgi:hypothetical protein